MAKWKAEKALAAANAYYETNRREVTLYESAERYLKDVLQGHFDPKKLPPIKQWKTEQTKLLSQKSALNNDYKRLKEEVRRVEVMRREVDKILSTDRLPQQRERSQGMAL